MVVRIVKLVCLIIGFAVVSLMPMSMVIDRVVPILIQRSDAMQLAITRVATALGLLTVKVSIESSSGENANVQAAPVLFLHEQLEEIAKQQLFDNNNKNKKQDPKNSVGGALSLVTSALVTKFKEECKKHKQYFMRKLTENKAIIDKLAQDIGIKIKSIDIEHIFKPTSKLHGTKLSGGHSTQLGQFTIEKVLHGVDSTNTCHTALISIINNTNRVVTDTKSQFPSSWNGQKIIETLFDSIPTIKRIIHAPNGKWLIIKDAGQQTYRIFLDSKGVIKTFFPEI